MSAAGAGRISVPTATPPVPSLLLPLLLRREKPDLIYYWHAARSHTAAISFRLVLRGASSGTATFPFWPGQHNLFFSFFLFFFCYLYFCFRFVFAPYLATPTTADIWPSLCFAFAFCFEPRHLALGIRSPGSSASAFIVCCALVCRKAVYLFIYVSQGPKKGHPGSTFIPVFSTQLPAGRLLQDQNLTLNSLGGWPKLR